MKMIAEMMKEKTLNYYNTNAEEYFKNTLNANMRANYSLFESYLKPGDYILDLGCGSGRDTKYFLENGYKVDAIDGSIELCKLASEYTGINAENKLFSDLDDYNKYNGIWACASLLHLTKEEMIYTLNKMVKSIKLKGVIYMSVKYGNEHGFNGDRYFTNLTEKSFIDDILSRIYDAEIVEMWTSKDSIDRDIKWLNIVLMKISDKDVFVKEQ